MALFKKDLIALILSDQKTQTRRIHKHGWEVGRTYKIKKCYYDKGQGAILITRKFKQQLSKISEEDAEKEGFATLEEFKKRWMEINGSWNPEQIVIAYEFQLVKKQNLEVT
jgi:hypothetical protein